MTPETAAAPPPVLRGVRFALLCLAILGATSLPYAWHGLRTPAGSMPWGSDFSNLGDILTYVAWMDQAAHGHLLFINLYDPRPQPRVLFLPFFLVLGRVAAATGAHPLLVLHAARIVAGAFVLLAARAWCEAFLATTAARTRAFLLLALATGLPGLIPEASPVSSLFDSSLQSFAWIFILLGGRAWLVTAGLRGALGAGACGAVLLLSHPYDAVTLAVVIAATSAWCLPHDGPRTLARAIAAAAVMLPAGIVVLHAMRENPALATWAGAPRPLWGIELPSFGTLGILALCEAWPRRTGSPLPARTRALLIVWAAAQIVLLHAPVPSPRRYIQGLQAPLALLAAAGFERLLAAGRPRAAKYLLACAFPAAPVMLLADMADIVEVPRHVSRRLLDDLGALRHLPPGLVMARPGLDYLVPPFSGRQVFGGHYDQTPAYGEKVAIAEAFADGCLGGADLAVHGIRWVVLDRGEECGFEGVRLVNATGRIRLYEVLPPVGSAP